MSSAARKMVPLRDSDGVQRSVHYFDSGKVPGCDSRPLLLLCGTCQTIDTWSPHVEGLCAGRRLIIPELRCIGKNTELLPQFESLHQYAEDIAQFLEKIDISEVDVAGFSLGGRIGVAFAAHKSHLVHRLSVTGVPLNRTAKSELILRSWREGLSSACCFRSTAWSLVLNGFSGNYLRTHSHRIPHFVQRVVSNNDHEKLSILLNNAHSSDDTAAAANCAHLIQCPTQIISATEDRISDAAEEENLFKAIQNSTFVRIEGAGHLSPFEMPDVWRQHLLSFLA